MLILLETAAGFALFKVNNEKKLNKVDDIYVYLEDTNNCQKLLSLVAFAKFKDTHDALTSTAKLLQGELSKKLTRFLNKNIVEQEIEETLCVSDKKIAKAIQNKLQIDCSSKQPIDLFKGIKNQLSNLVQGLTEQELAKLTLGLSHGLSRYKLQFSSDKVDTMIIQAIALLDDLDKEINNYMMRLREWYGWHFPEMSKIVTDNLTYAKCVKLIGMRHNTANTDLSDVLNEEIEKEVKQAAEISMGTEINETDEMHINQLANQITDLSEYRESLSEYLKNRMQAIAPNLTVLVGELIGSRLISHAGSLVNLAKYPGSTIQILGAEKALFKAIKTKQKTPKYGLLYQASLVGNANSKVKGKIARSLASKCSLCVRYDALQEEEECNNELGVNSKVALEKRVAFLENQSQNTNFQPQRNQYQQQQKTTSQGSYNTKADVQIKKTGGASSWKKQKN